MVKVCMVVFDMAGTTVNEGKIVYRSVTRALNNVGVDISVDTVISEIAGWNKKKGISHLVNKYHPASTNEIIENAHNDFLEIVEHEYRTNPDVEEMEGATALFKYLRGQGIKIVLDTGYHRRTADILINRLEWQEKIDMSITSDEVPEGRPHPHMINKARQYFNIEEADCVMKVGDAPADIEEGHNAGCGMVVAMMKNNPNRESVMKEKPTHTINHLAEIEDLLSL